MAFVFASSHYKVLVTMDYSIYSYIYAGHGNQVPEQISVSSLSVSLTLIVVIQRY